MTALLAALLAVFAVTAWPRRDLPPRLRRRDRTAAPAAGLGTAALPAVTPLDAPAPRAGRARVSPRFAIVAAAAGVWALAGPRAGPAAALLAAAGTARLAAVLPSRATAERDRACGAAVPLLADLVAACVVAGAALDAATVAAATATGGPLGTEVSTAAGAVRLGTPAPAAYAPLTARERPPPVRALGRALARSADTGAAPADVLRAVADDARAAARAAGETAARRAAVHAVLPLGACFLPAFVLLGVVPLVASLLAHVVT